MMICPWERVGEWEQKRSLSNLIKKALIDIYRSPSLFFLVLFFFRDDCSTSNLYY